MRDMAASRHNRRSDKFFVAEVDAAAKKQCFQHSLILMCVFACVSRRHRQSENMELPGLKSPSNGRQGESPLLS